MFKKFIPLLLAFVIMGSFISCNSTSKKDTKEATKVADLIGAKHNIPIHLSSSSSASKN